MIIDNINPAFFTNQIFNKSKTNKNHKNLKNVKSFIGSESIFFRFFIMY